MVDAFQPPEPADQQGISLDVLTQAYAEALSGQLPASRSEEAGAEDPAAGQLGSQEAELLEGLPLPVDGGAGEDGLAADDPVGVSPTTVLETMLFVGSMDNQPLEPGRAAGLMRGVTPGDVVGMVEQLNVKYTSNGCPYKVVHEGAGYRMTLRRAFYPLRNKFYGRVREARLSQAAIDTLAIVAYRQPLTADQVSQLRGTPSGHLLTQLVRRQLLKVERPKGTRTMVYRTSPRFLELFGLESLGELPDSE